MLAKLFQAIFLPKRTRDKLADQAKGGRRPGRRAPSGQPQVAAGRDPCFLMPDAVRDLIIESDCYATENS